MHPYRLSFFACLSIAAALHAQDPGFQPAKLPSSQPQPAQTQVSNSGDEVRSAGLINSMEQLDNTTQLQPDYQISFRILEDRNEPIRLRVQDSGDIQAPHVGLVRAAGRTCRELAFAVKKELEKSYYQTATVIIAIDVIPRNPYGAAVAGGGGTFVRPGMEFFTIFGHVIRQGKYELPLDEDVTISQAILRAGGPAQFANLNKVKLIRKTPQGNKAVQVNVEAIMKNGALERDIYIRNNDVLIIPEKAVNF
ncbi:MAG: polysaccharide biosynthesis/export family protein [Verrucomicrobiaceae bacterium]|nr:polysaccharide biosynthesis/export family protein [Verrucomicrobiaceae bacterium]